MFCAQIVGNPEIAPEPTAAPARLAAPLRTGRRGTPCAACDPVAPDGFVVMSGPSCTVRLGRRGPSRPDDDGDLISAAGKRERGPACERRHRLAGRRALASTLPRGC